MTERVGMGRREVLQGLMGAAGAGLALTAFAMHLF